MTTTTAPATTRVAVLVGSLREGSTHRRLAEILKAETPAGVEIDIVEGLDQVPFYNEDLDGETAPAAATALRERIARSDRVFVLTPEYNGTIPAVLNNAIDWLSRPYGAGALVGKPLAVAGATPTPYGGKWAHADTLRSVGIAGAIAIEDLTISHGAPGEDVTADTALHARLRDALAQLAAFTADENAA